MAKQPKKSTRQDKAAGKVVQATKKEPKPLVQKGPVPDFTQNADRVAARENQSFASAISEGRLRFAAFVAGVEGEYLIGTTKGRFPSGFPFAVKMKQLPKTDNKPAFEMLVIEEVEPTRMSMRVYIPHAMLFAHLKDTTFRPGFLGDVQHEMTVYLQGILYDHIVEERERRRRAEVALMFTQLNDQKQEATSPKEAATA